MSAPFLVYNSKKGMHSNRLGTAGWYPQDSAL